MSANAKDAVLISVSLFLQKANNYVATQCTDNMTQEEIIHNKVKYLYGLAETIMFSTDKTLVNKEKFLLPILLILKEFGSPLSLLYARFINNVLAFEKNEVPRLDAIEAEYQETRCPTCGKRN